MPLKNVVKRREYQKKRHADHPEIDLFRTCKFRAKKKGLLFNLTKEDIVVPDLCPILGIPLFVKGNKVTENSPSIDRIDNSQGYIKGNIQIISYKANTMKSNATLNELKLLVNYLETLGDLVNSSTKQ